MRNKWALPKDDTCAPDLYIPSMSFITYVLLYVPSFRPPLHALSLSLSLSASFFTSSNA
jgi:hypothetical protein